MGLNMFLDYAALFLVFFVFITMFYGIIAIHDIPYEIAVHRNHPHQDAIHYAGWVSLFTLHVLWPFLWIWSTLYREDRGWGFSSTGKQSADDLQAELASMKQELARIEALINKQQPENTPSASTAQER